MSVTEANNKTYKPGLYNEAINDLIHNWYWKKSIKEELQNLENYQTWEYEKLPFKREAIGLKWVFKVKYCSNGSLNQQLAIAIETLIWKTRNLISWI